MHACSRVQAITLFWRECTENSAAPCVSEWVRLLIGAVTNEWPAELRSSAAAAAAARWITEHHTAVAATVSLQCTALSESDWLQPANRAVYRSVNHATRCPTGLSLHVLLLSCFTSNLSRSLFFLLSAFSKSMLNHCLEWDKWVLTNHDRQWFSTLIPPSHEYAAVTVDCISRLSRPVRLMLRYITPDIHCRDRRYEWHGGISRTNSSLAFVVLGVSNTLLVD